MSEVGFYLCGGLLVLSCIAAMALRSFEGTLAATVGLSFATSLLALVTGADALAVIGLLLMCATAAVVWFTVREKWAAALAEIPWGEWQGAAAVGLLSSIVLVGTFILTKPNWHEGIQSARLITLLHYRAPLIVLLLIAVLACGLALAFFAARVSPDELESDAQRQARIDRENRLRRRREDRLAARQQRQQSRRGGDS